MNARQAAETSHGTDEPLQVVGTFGLLITIYSSHVYSIDNNSKNLP